MSTLPMSECLNCLDMVPHVSMIREKDGERWFCTELCKLGYSREKAKLDAVNHPAHYNAGKIEVLEFIEDQKLNVNRAQVVKYVARAGRKDSKKEVEDLEKALFYLRREIELLNAARENREPCRPNQMTKKLEKGLRLWVRVHDEAETSSNDWNPNYDWNVALISNKPTEGYTEFTEVK